MIMRQEQTENFRFLLGMYGNLYPVLCLITSFREFPLPSVHVCLQLPVCQNEDRTFFFKPTLGGYMLLIIFGFFLLSTISKALVSPPDFEVDICL